MSGHDLAALLETAVSETLENMVFAEAELVESGGTPDWDNIRGARIEVLDPIRVSLTLAVSEGLINELADVISGGEPGLDEAPTLEPGEIEDALAELINTIAGRLMAGLIPAGQKFELGLPEPQDKLEARDEGTLYCFEAGGNDLWIVTRGSFKLE